MADERSDLLAALNEARSVLVATAAGLTDEQARATPSVSSLSIGGLIKHVTATERQWVAFVQHGASAVDLTLPDGVSWADIFSGTAITQPQWAIEREREFQMTDGDELASLLADYQLAAAATDDALASIADLVVQQQLPDAPWYEQKPWSARRVFYHLVVEISQHAGHADIIRESIDGHTAT